MSSKLQHGALQAPRTLALTSPAFRQGEPIPREFSGHGDDVSPPLAWSGVPAGTKAFALVVDDPDAPGGTWTHWTAWNLRASTAGLARGEDVDAQGGVEGLTSARTTGYHGPAPPSGTHRYFFRVFALREPLPLAARAGIDDVWRALATRTLAWGELMGTFSRP